jgi:hypothetical protein
MACSSAKKLWTKQIISPYQERVLNCDVGQIDSVATNCLDQARISGVNLPPRAVHIEKANVSALAHPFVIRGAALQLPPSCPRIWTLLKAKKVCPILGNKTGEPRQKSVRRNITLRTTALNERLKICIATTKRNRFGINPVERRKPRENGLEERRERTPLFRYRWLPSGFDM